jgi:hypothetical protein
VKHVDRRTFLLTAGGAAAVAATTRLELGHLRAERVRRRAGRLQNARGAIDLGIEYLTRVPGDDDEAGLIARLTAIDIDEQIRRDFVGGDVLSMGGWLLARTELRLCALAALERGRQMMTHGVFTPAVLPGGDRCFWTSPSSRLQLSAGMESLDFQVRSGAAEPQRLLVRLAGKTIDERHMSRGGWHSASYRLRPARSRPLLLELTVTPAWVPVNDFRTIGIGIDRIWSAV